MPLSLGAHMWRIAPCLMSARRIWKHTVSRNIVEIAGRSFAQASRNRDENSDLLSVM
jgi:hypothetical protein